MRSILLAGCLICLAAFAAPVLAEAAADEAATPALAIVEEAPAPQPAAAAPAPADAADCSAEPLALGGGGFNNWCGTSCTPTSGPLGGGGDNVCVAYDCRGILAIGDCTCVNNRWACDWDCQFD